MKQLEKIVRDNFYIDDETKPHLGSILAEMSAEIEQGVYDDDSGRVSHYTICEVFDNKLFDILGPKSY